MAARGTRFTLALALASVVIACGSSEAPHDPAQPAAQAPGSDASSPSSEALDAAAPPATFALQVKTERVDGVLVLRTNLPADATACAALPVENAPCEDVDGDGLVDVWENVVLDRMRPRIELDEGEPLLTDSQAKLAFVGRVTPRAAAGAGPRLVLAYLMIGYSRDYGSCGVSGHNGDNERVVLELSVSGGDATMSRAYTAAHEGSPVDDGHVYSGASLLSELHFVEEKGEPRWLVLSSKGKHATYANDATCAAHSKIPCLSESCSADNVANVDGYRILPPFVNAGEPAKHLVDDLTAIGFPGEGAWATVPFCGGLGGSTCASADADKLTVDPFP